ncbi:hypothetical protein GCM10027277_56720 [Pseudoduganella ginsengisoli]|uniref:Uncharacterized protein n=1 Tax=Pseudoduganella ginsengisoli TaxID=1462440 RepID=A0A6L6Q2X0_9BURK|nr:hypothetical protein [Pseudoduganella ginsengisoli]MTW03955.1 hypothetical protein [Pseudoduganella ginsengisoli]
MTFSTLDSARLIRDGGIDALSALDMAVREAIVGLPPEEQTKVKRAFGEAMGCIVEHLINPAVRAFPQLDTDQATWSAIAESRATLRARISPNSHASESPSAPLT